LRFRAAAVALQATLRSWGSFLALCFAAASVREFNGIGRESTNLLEAAPPADG